MERLIEGALRFREEAQTTRASEFSRLAKGQTPVALFIGCSDSRVVPEFLTQSEPGNLFVIRNAGNIVPSYGPAAGGVSGSVEYALAVLDIQNVVICGHSGCGAMKGILNADKLDGMPAVANWIRHADAAKQVVDALMPEAGTAERLNALVHENVLCQLRNLQTHPVVAARLATGRLKLFGWVNEIESGQVDTFDAASGRFVPLAAGELIHATPQRRAMHPFAEAGGQGAAR